VCVCVCVCVCVYACVCECVCVHVCANVLKSQFDTQFSIENDYIADFWEFQKTEEIDFWELQRYSRVLKTNTALTSTTENDCSAVENVYSTV